MMLYSEGIIALSAFFLLNVSLKVINAASIESMCSKFAYEEQLLEKMVRMEFYMENMQKELRKLVTDAIENLSSKYAETVTKLSDISGKLVRYEKSVEQIENNKLENKIIGQINSVQKRIDDNLNETVKFLERTSSELNNLKGN